VIGASATFSGRVGPDVPAPPTRNAGDRVDVHGFAIDGVLVGSFETFTDLRGNPNRAKIIGSPWGHGLATEAATAALGWVWKHTRSSLEMLGQVHV